MRKLFPPFLPFGLIKYLTGTQCSIRYILSRCISNPVGFYLRFCVITPRPPSQNFSVTGSFLERFQSWREVTVILVSMIETTS